MSTRQPLHPAFCQMIRSLLPEEADRLLDTLDTPPSVSVRLSRTKPCRESLPFVLEDAVPWSGGLGFYLSERPSFTADPLWHAGGYYVQEASSMLLSCIAPLLGGEPIDALDLCAAPGGKSTLLLDLLPRGSALVSNEIMRARAQILTENIQKWGSASSIVTSAEPQMLGRLREAFDLILVDAPCSGEGMFRKDEEARQQWSPDLVQQCAERQRGILEDIWPALRPGGLMVYSTCTYSEQEDESQLRYLIEELGAEALPLPELPPIVTPSPLCSYPCYRMMPHRLRGEGLFLALVRKPSQGEGYATSRPAAKGKGKPTTTKIPEAVKAWLRPEALPSLHWQSPTEGLFVALPQRVAALTEALRALRVPILSSGGQVAEAKGRDFLPLPALALSELLDPEAFPAVELTHPEAIRYLAREAITLPEGTPRGFVLVRYRGLALGFVKHLGNRSNNLYPQPWRIRHPEQILSLGEH